MEKERSYMTERILHLTLEIIYLLTGEDYGPVAKGAEQHVMPNSCSHTLPRWSKNQTCIRELSPPFPPPGKENDRRILEVTQKIIELLTGEVPIRFQDVSVYFSMEEWEYLEGHKDLYKDVLEDHQTLTSPDGSSNGNPSERCPWLYSQEHEKVTKDFVDLCHDPAYDYQGENPLVKVEDFETGEPYVEGDEPSQEEGELPPEITIDGRYKNYNTEKSPLMSEDKAEDNFIKANSVGEKLRKPDLHSLLHNAHLLSVPSTIRRNFSDHSQSFTRPTHEMVSKSYQEIHSQEKPYSCSECGKGFGKKANLARHQTMHADGKRYSCSECGKAFLRKSSFVEHQRMHKGEKMYSCSECGKCFQWRSTLFYHQRRHKDGRYNKNTRGRRRSGNFTADPQRVVPILPKPNPVLPCLYLSSVPIAHIGSFTGLPDPSTHYTAHIREEPFIGPEHSEPSLEAAKPVSPHGTYKEEEQLPISPYQEDFDHKPNPMDHDKPLTVKNEFSCLQCGKSFVEESNLLKHQKNHSQSKPYPCPLCGKAFSKKSNLLRHQRMHSKEKLFSCSECGKCFLRKSVLVEHQRMHTGEKKYRCSECGKCFQWRSSHFYHIRKHRGVMPVSCLECGKSFAQKSHLIQHQKMHAAEKHYLIFNSIGTER
ncbi:uncharacterized protein [Pyxicephalus adspersus]|uniref:uncharacterized protein isoform X2 n=1 Tax=Pyxicephalus adspersus TaxID=30357 RepID=UPI003B5D0481